MFDLLRGLKKSQRFLVFISLGAALALVVWSIPHFLEMVAFMGREISSPDMQIDYGLGWAWAVFLAFIIWLMPFRSQERLSLLLLWICKCFVTLGVMLLYESYYGLDAFGYFYNAHAPLDWSLFTSGSGTKMITGLTAVGVQFVPFLDSYHALKVVYSMFGLVGSFFLYWAAKRVLGFTSIWPLYFLGLFPSVLFWGSILGKDPLVYCFICIAVSGAVLWFSTERWYYLVFVFIGVILASFIRPWTGPILIVPLVIHKVFRPGRLIPKIVVISILAIIFTIFAQQIGDAFKVQTFDDLMERTNSLSRAWSVGGSAQDVPELGSIGSMLKFIPFAAFTALFRPFPGEIMNPFGILAGLESLFVLLLVSYSLYLVRGRIWRDSIMLWSFSTAFFWAIVYGFISYQNLGAGYRFRLQVMPFILFLFIYVIFHERKSVKSSENQ